MEVPLILISREKGQKLWAKFLYLFLTLNGKCCWAVMVSYCEPPLQYQYWPENGMGKTDIRDEIMSCHHFPVWLKEVISEIQRKPKLSWYHLNISIWVFKGFFAAHCSRRKAAANSFFFFSIHSLIVIYEKHYIIDIIFMVLDVPLIKTTKLHFPSSHPFPILLLFECTAAYYSLLFTWLISPYCYGPRAFNLQKSHMYAKLADP